jgi:hypothetical protein
VGLVVVTAAITAALAHQVPRSLSAATSGTSATAPSATATSSPPAESSAPSSAAPPLKAPPGDQRRADRKGAHGKADGELPDGVTAFDDGYPGVAGLDPELLQALREASTDAAADGVELYVNSGWRSRELQSRLLREAVSTYGSEKEAARWVSTPDTSPHVAGDAVDVGPSGAASWLSEHGAEYGLCQIYRNEPWHYELRATATDHGCPRRYADPTRDPRMQQ